jgi:predicted DNA repair protein MutK
MKFLRQFNIEGIAHAALLGVIAMEWISIFISAIFKFSYVEYIKNIAELIDSGLSIIVVVQILNATLLTGLLFIVFFGVLVISVGCVNYVWKKLGLSQLLD